MMCAMSLVDSENVCQQLYPDFLWDDVICILDILNQLHDTMCLFQSHVGMFQMFD